MDEEPEAERLTRLKEPDVEHCFWRHGHAAVFERLARRRAEGDATPRYVIAKAIERHSKPGVAFELLASVAAAGSDSPPAPLRRAIETCVGLARRSARPPSAR
jgi:putative ATP-dependent endonuclease of OLD family